MKSSGISWSRTLCTRMLTPWSTMRRASASSTICAMVILPCLRAWSITAAVNSGVSLGWRPPWASIHTFTKSAPLPAISSTLARASSGVFASEPGLNGSDMKRYMTVRMRAPWRSPAFCRVLELLHVVLVEVHAGRGGNAVERVLAQLRIARRRPDMAVAVDDAGHHEFAGEVDDGRAGPRRTGQRPGRGCTISRMRPFSITIVTLCCGAAPVPSMTVALVRTVSWARGAAAAQGRRNNDGRHGRTHDQASLGIFLQYSREAISAAARGPCARARGLARMTNGHGVDNRKSSARPVKQVIRAS